MNVQELFWNIYNKVIMEWSDEVFYECLTPSLLLTAAGVTEEDYLYCTGPWGHYSEEGNCFGVFFWSGK